MQIKIKNLHHTYSPKTPFEFKALTNVSATFNPGEITAVIGQTGSGKSTLVQHLNVLLRPTSGEVHIGDHIITNETKKIKNVKEIRKECGLVFQFPEYQLFESTIIKDVMFGPKKLGQTKEEAEESAKESLTKVGIDEALYEDSPFNISGGQKRRVAIAGILAIKNSTIVFDEPTAGLDPQGEKNIMNLIHSLKDEGKSVVIVTHNLEHALQYADRVLIMKDGELKIDTSKEELFKNPDVLLEYDLKIPDILEFVIELKKKGFKFNKTITSIEELVSTIKKQLK